MGLYDAVDRGGAGRKKERTLRRPLLNAAEIFAAVIALIAWSCRYFFQYRSWVSDLTEATRYARRTGAFTVTVAGAAAEAEAAQNALEALGGRLAAIEEVPIPGRDWAHTLAVLAKTSPTPEKYPRRVGVPEKRPL